MKGSDGNAALIVEDELFIVLELEDILLEMGYGKVNAFSEVAAALSWLEHGKPAIAIVDYHLKGGTAEDLIAVLAEASVPTVIYSGRSYDPQIDQALSAYEWLMKPADETMLAAAIARASGDV
ncbi:response regulator [Rhizobium grahamii]|uniref:Response regulator n=1 Tax=Rhizobium grahamii TaxID=1120045 RepID=A0A5Q0CB53_9HYPH|nr:MULTISPECIES: response regulator [Rhizobium]QFY61111.1 response regulator [Rhizobium grahamii]QRM49736.1 response regulator [Rhizobium sp. BG6]